MTGVLSLILLVVGVGCVAFLFGLAISGLLSGTGVEAWAHTNGVTLSPTTAPVVEVYLRKRRGLRRVGALGGVLIPPAVTAATGIDLHVAGIVWLLVGYTVGQLVAELSFGRRATSPTRAASLSPRRLADYVPRSLAVAQLALPVAGGLLGVVVVIVTGDIPPRVPLDPGSYDPTAGALVAAPLGILLAAAAIVGERRLVRRPQPIVEPELVTLDDAMRSSSVRVVAATNVVILALLIVTQLAGIAANIDAGALQTSLWIVMAGLLLAAYWSWQWWVRRGWQVARPGVTVRPGVPA